MDIKIQINGTFLEGLTKRDVKLSINASSPYSFGESTRTYSANIKAPRNRVNDGIFYQIRNFGYVMRDTKYEARIYIGGIVINKRFKAMRRATALPFLSQTLRCRSCRRKSWNEL